MSVIIAINGGAEAKVSMEAVKTFLENVWKKLTEMSEREENTTRKIHITTEGRRTILCKSMSVGT